MRRVPSARTRANPLPQHPQVLGDGGLADAELVGNHRRHRPGGLLPVGEQFQNAAADRIAEDIKRVHRARMQVPTYVSPGL